MTMTPGIRKNPTFTSGDAVMEEVIQEKWNLTEASIDIDTKLCQKLPLHRHWMDKRWKKLHPALIVRDIWPRSQMAWHQMPEITIPGHWVNMWRDKLHPALTRRISEESKTALIPNVRYNHTNTSGDKVMEEVASSHHKENQQLTWSQSFKIAQVPTCGVNRCSGRTEAQPLLEIGKLESAW